MGEAGRWRRKPFDQEALQRGLVGDVVIGGE
jgi:hypothetical protein